MADSLGEIVVSVVADTKNLEKGLKNTETNISKLDKTSNELQQTSKDTQTEIDKTTKSVEKLGTSGDDASKGVNKAGDEIEETGKKSKKADDDILKLDKAFDKLKSAFTATALLASLGLVINKLIDLQNQAIDTRNALKNIAETPVESTELEAYIQRDEQLLKGYTDKNQVKEVVIQVRKDFTDLTDQQIVDLEQKVLEMSSTFGIGIRDLTEKLRAIGGKWNIEDSEMLQILEQMRMVSAKMGGDNSINFQSLLSVLNDNDKSLIASNMSLEDVFKSAIKYDDKINNRDFTEFGSFFDMQWKNAQKLVQDAQENLVDAQNDYRSLLIDLERAKEELYTVRRGDDEKAIANAEKEVDKIESSISVLEASIKEYNTVIDKGVNGLLQDLVSGEDYKGMMGKNLEDTLEAFQIAGVAKDTDLKDLGVELKSYTESLGTSVDSFQDELGKATSQFGVNVNNLINRSEEHDKLVDINNELLKSITEEAGLSSLTGDILFKFGMIKGTDFSDYLSQKEINKQYMDIAKEYAPETYAKFSKEIIPTLDKIDTQLNDKILPSTEDLADGFQDNSDIINNTYAPAMDNLATSISNAAEAYRELKEAQDACGM